MGQNAEFRGRPGGASAEPVTRATVCLLVLLSALFLVWPMFRATLPLEVWPNEGWNAYHADAAFDPRALYPPPDGLVANNYPPLSFLAIKTLAVLFGDALYVGRVLSLLALLALGSLVYVIAQQFEATRLSAALGGVWFIATMTRFFDFYVGMNEPQLLAQAVMAGGLAWFLARQQSGRAVEPAVLLMVIAGFIKHSLIAYPGVALLWLALHDWRLALRAALVGLAAAACGLALCAWFYAPDFLTDLLLMPRDYRFARMLKSIGRLQFVLPALLLWAIWAWSARSTKPAQFTVLFVLAALVSYLLQKTGVGVDENAQFDLVFALAIGIGITFGHLDRVSFRTGWPPARIAMVATVVLVARLLASTRLESAYVLFSPDYRAEAALHADGMRAEAARIASMPGPVACTNLLVCRMAGKPFVLDRFLASQLIATGRMTQLDIDAKMRAAGARLIWNDRSSAAPSLYRR